MAKKQNLGEALSSRTQALLTSGLSGTALCRSLTDEVDSRLVSLFTDVVSSPKEAAPASAGLALVAVGGYGRREMSPFSDIDIMLLGRSREAAATEAAQAVLYRLWDEGINISHCFRTLGECVEDALADLTTRTSLIEARFLAGERAVFDEFKQDCSQRILFKRKREFVAELLREIERRHRTYGESVYLLEPNLKEGPGGLRDLHSLSWLARVELRLTDLEALRGTIAEADLRSLLRSYEFLLRARAALQLLSRRRNDVLSFEFQRDTAALLGFGDTKRFTGEEILMRLYYKKARTVTEALAKIMGLCGRRYVSFPLNFTVKRLTDDFSLSKDEIIVKNKDLLKSTDKLLEAFALAATTGKRLSSHLKEHIRGRVLFINKRTRASQRAVGHFLAVLRSSRVSLTLREMHETGVLDRFLPEFGSLRHLVISEPYHRYTVDEHSLIALRTLEALGEAREAKLFPLAALLKKVKRENLYLAVLLHDAGKGVSKRHEEAGYRMLKGVMERFRIDRQDRKAVAFLVKNHVALSRLALARDIDAPETAARLAELAESEENLDALYLMTYADMSAVNPTFWTDWKASLLRALYLRTKEHLAGSGREPVVREEALREFVESMPRRYLIATTNDIINADYALIRKAAGEGVAVGIAERQEGAAEIVVATRDLPGLFARIAGVLSAQGLNILGARLYNGSTGMVIDKIIVSNWKEIGWEGMEEQVAGELRTAILHLSAGAPCSNAVPPGNAAAPRDLPPLLAGSAEEYSFRPFFRFEPSVELDNEASTDYTILELFLPDRFGLLRDIALRFCGLGIEIISAVITTEEGIAQDVFYLRHGGRQLGAEAALNLLQALELSSSPAGGAAIGR